MKYIKTVRPNGAHEIFTFPDTVDHDKMSEALQMMREYGNSGNSGGWSRMGLTPVSAGFVDNEGTCHGKSETLGLASDSADSDLLLSQINGYA